MSIEKDFDEVKFGKGSQMFFELSPYYFCTFEAGGKKWRTLIHYWVASYFKNDDMKEIIRNLDTPDKALKVGKRHGFRDFDQVDAKNIIYAIQERYNQNDGLRTILLSTGSVNLIYDGIGFLAEKNRYGKILMKVREIYAAK